MTPDAQLEDKMYTKTKNKLRRIAPIIELLANALTAGAFSFLVGLTFEGSLFGHSFGGSLAWGIATAVGVYAVVVAYVYGERRGFKRGMLVKYRE